MKHLKACVRDYLFKRIRKPFLEGLVHKPQEQEVFLDLRRKLGIGKPQGTKDGHTSSLVERKVFFSLENGFGRKWPPSLSPASSTFLRDLE